LREVSLVFFFFSLKGSCKERDEKGERIGGKLVMVGG
jgi:hypothetical protein